MKLGHHRNKGEYTGEEQTKWKASGSVLLWGILAAWQTAISSLLQLIESFFSCETGWYKLCPAIFTLLCQSCRIQSFLNGFLHERKKRTIFTGRKWQVLWLARLFFIRLLIGSIWCSVHCSTGGGEGGDSLSSSWHTGFDGFFFSPVFFSIIFLFFCTCLEISEYDSIKERWWRFLHGASVAFALEK